MKRTILAVAAVLAMAACGGSSKDPRPAVESLYSNRRIRDLRWRDGSPVGGRERHDLPVVERDPSCR